MIARALKSVAVASAIAALLSGSAFAAEFATKDEAMAMVKKAVAFIKAQGPEKGYAEISKKGSQFTDRDLYVVVYGLNGTVYAHGANEKLINTDQSQAKDVDGKPFVQERIALAKKGDPFWQDYKFLNPVSKNTEPKQMYCERLNETAVCGGVYKL
jgi:signal transduction histidine kinase